MLLDFMKALPSRVRLLRCVRLGRSPRVLGRVWIHGRGHVQIGDRVRIDGRQAPVEFHAGPGARLVIGDDVAIGGGVSIEAMGDVSIGDRVRIEGFARVIDNHFHNVVGNRLERPPSSPVSIGPDTSVGWRAILLPGASTAPGSTVPAGAIVRPRTGPSGLQPSTREAGRP